MKHTFFVMVATIMLFTAGGCYYDKEDQLYPNASFCDTTNVTYSGAVKFVVEGKCATPGCHVAGGQSPDLSTYTGISANIARVKVRALDLKTMPTSGPLSSCDAAKLSKWINAGNPNN